MKRIFVLTIVVFALGYYEALQTEFDLGIQQDETVEDTSIVSPKYQRLESATSLKQWKKRFSDSPEDTILQSHCLCKHILSQVSLKKTFLKGYQNDYTRFFNACVRLILKSDLGENPDLARKTLTTVFRWGKRSKSSRSINRFLTGRLWKKNINEHLNDLVIYDPDSLVCY